MVHSSTAEKSPWNAADSQHVSCVIFCWNKMNPSFPQIYFKGCSVDWLHEPSCTDFNSVNDPPKTGQFITINPTHESLSAMTRLVTDSSERAFLINSTQTVGLPVHLKSCRRSKEIHFPPQQRSQFAFPLPNLNLTGWQIHAVATPTANLHLLFWHVPSRVICSTKLRFWICVRLKTREERRDKKIQ